MSDQPGQNPKQDDQLTARLVSRLTEPVGLIDTRQPEQKYARTDWVAERFSLAARLSDRYAAQDQNASSAQTYVLGRPLQPQLTSFADESSPAAPLSSCQPEFSMAGPRNSAPESSPSSGEKLRVSRRSRQIALKSGMATPQGESSTGFASKPEQAALAASDETRLQRSSPAQQLAARSPESQPPLILSEPALEGVPAKSERSSRALEQPSPGVRTESTQTSPLAQRVSDAAKSVHGATDATEVSNGYSEPQPANIRSNTASSSTEASSSGAQFTDGVNQAQTNSEPVSGQSRIASATSIIQRKKAKQSDDSGAATKSPARGTSQASSDQRLPLIQRRRKQSPANREVEQANPALPKVQLDRLPAALVPKVQLDRQASAASPKVKLDREASVASPPSLPLAKSRKSPAQRKKKDERANTQKHHAVPEVQASSPKESSVNSDSTDGESLAAPAQSAHDSALRVALPLPLPASPDSAVSLVQRKRNKRAEEPHLETEARALADSEGRLPESQRLRNVSRVESSRICAAAPEEELPLARKPEESLASSKPPPPTEGMTLQRKSLDGHASTSNVQTASPADKGPDIGGLEQHRGAPRVSAIESSNIIVTESEHPTVIPREESRMESPTQRQPLVLSASRGLKAQRKKERSAISQPKSDSANSAASKAGMFDLPSAPGELSGNGNDGPRPLVAVEIRDNSGPPLEPAIIWRKPTGAPKGEAVPSITGGPAHLARTTEASISSGNETPQNAPPAAAASAPTQGGNVDLERITQRVLHDIARRLEVERERRGLGKWA